MIGLRYGAVVTVAEISSQMGEFKPMPNREGNDDTAGRADA